MIGINIKKRRKELNLTQDELAKQAEISKGFLSEIENDKKSISADNLNRIARVLHCSIDSLMNDNGFYDVRIEPKEVEIPAGLSEMAKEKDLPYSKVMVILDLRNQILAHRKANDKENEFDWYKFYDSVKEFIK